MADDRPVWLLDVDGVLEGSRPGWHAVPRRDRLRLADGTELRYTWAPALVERINRVHRGGAVEIRWATSWITPGAIRDVAVHELAALFGLPTGLPLAWQLPAAQLSPGQVLAAKRRAAIGVVRAGRRLVWTDDNAIPRLGPHRAELDKAGALLIAPSVRTGLLPEHLDHIEAYLAAGRR